MDGGHVVLDSTGMLYDRILAYWTAECQKKKDERLVHGRYTTGLRPRADNDKGFEGDRRVDRLRYYLENGFVDDQGKRIIRSKEQRLIHETYIRTCLPKIYQVSLAPTQCENCASKRNFRVERVGGQPGAHHCPVWLVQAAAGGPRGHAASFWKDMGKASG